MTTRPLIAAPFAWTSVTPQDSGFKSDLDQRLDGLIADKRASGLHGVVVARMGQIVLERYFAGEV